MSDRKSDHKYKVAYKIIPLADGKTKAEIQADPELKDCGATDSFILISTIEPKDGSRSVAWSSSDGAGEELPTSEIFESMVVMARTLALGGGLDKGREAVCWSLWNTQLTARNLPRQDLEETRRRFGPGGKRDR